MISYRVSIVVLVLLVHMQGRLPAATSKHGHKIRRTSAAHKEARAAGLSAGGASACDDAPTTRPQAFADTFRLAFLAGVFFAAVFPAVFPEAAVAGLTDAVLSGLKPRALIAAASGARAFSYPSQGELPMASRSAMFCAVQWAALSSSSSSSQATGTETPMPGLARADQAHTVVAPKPLRR